MSDARLSFAKMHGAGNDFVVLTQAPPEPPEDARVVVWMCDRRHGVGADGALWMERLPGDDALFRMHFYNCDGGRVNLCLNGARCVAQRALDLGWASERFRFLTEHGSLEAEPADGGDVTLWLNPPSQAPQTLTLPEGSPAQTGSFVDTGDPHLVLEVAADVLSSPHFVTQARALRHWSELPEGANVHFVRRDAQRWWIRSFERGVEDETLACGSGCISAVRALPDPSGSGPIPLQTASGAIIKVDPSRVPWAMTGPARTVFTGELHLEDARAFTP